MTRGEIESWLVARLARQLGVAESQIDVREPFAQFGLGSLAIVALSGELEQLTEQSLSPAVLYEHHTIAALAAHLTGASAEQTEAPAMQEANEDPIALVGIGCRVPGARGKDEFWELLRAGRDMISEVPAERFDVASVFDDREQRPGKTITRWGGFLDDIAVFDAPFFGIAPREATRMDPQQRLLLETTYEALEDAGIASDELAGTRTGVFIGISFSEYGSRQLADSARVEALSGTGSALSIAANRLSYFFDFRGPSLAVDTACSSSLVAVHLACRSLRSGESSTAIVGGVNLLLDSGPFISFSHAGLMAPDGRCKTFDAKADGYVRGEGVGVVVLKRLSQALADGDRVYAVVRGSAVVQDGRSNGLMAPNPRAQQSVIRSACRDAGIEPAEIDFVEAHGTGTALGDAIELKSLGTVVGAGRSRDRPCSVGSVKTNIGHLEAAAGIVGLIKTALSLHNNELVSTLHFDEPNREVPFGELGLRVQTGNAGWFDEGATKRLAGVSSFGFGGTNAHVVLESAPETAAAHADAAGPYLLPISAKSPESLVSLARRYRDVLQRTPSLGGVVAASAARRNQLERRIAVYGDTAQEMTAALDDFVEGRPNQDVFALDRAGLGRKVVFTFSGHGSQRTIMGAELAERFPVFRSALERCDALLQREFSISLLEEIRHGDRLAETEIAQPAIVAVQIALVELWRAIGVVPAAVVGHSVGEISAAYAAGAFSLEQAMRLAARRGRLMQRTAGRGRMLAVRLSPVEAEQRIAKLGLNDRVVIGAVNSPTNVVLSGDLDAAQTFEAALASEGNVQALAFNHAFHSHHMDSVWEEFVDQLRGLEPQKLAVPMISTVTGTAIEGRYLHADYWGRNMREPVSFGPAIETLVAEGHDLFIEIAGQAVLERYVQEILRDGARGGTSVCSLKRGRSELTSIFVAAAELYAHGATQNLKGLLSPADDSTVPAPFAELPTYPFHAERYWLDARPELAPVNRGAHPLLGKHIALEHSPGAHIWTNELDAVSTGYLTEHRVQGMPTMPAAAFIEVALATMVETGEGSAFSLQEVEFQRLLPLPDDGTVELQTSLLADAADVPTVRISSHGQSAFTLHCHAKVVSEAAAHRGTTPDTFSEVRERCLERVVPAGLYAFLAERELAYGPSFRGLRELWRGEGEALGRIELAENLSSQLGSHVIHPALLDACFHVFGVLAPFEGSGLVVPRKIREVRFFDFAGNEVFSHVHTRGPREGDVRLYDSEGSVVAELLGLEFAQAGAAVEASTSELDCYTLEWRMAEATPKSCPNEARLSYLLFAEANFEVAPLRDKLKARGHTVATVGVADDADICIPPSATVQEMVVALRKVTDIRGPDEWGIAYICGAGTVTSDASTDACLRETSRRVTAVVSLVQALSASGANATRLWIVTQGAQAVRPGESVANLTQAPLAGIAKALAFERPELRSVLVDADVSETASERTASIERELFEDDTESEVALRNGVRYVPRVVERDTRDLVMPMKLQDDRQYLVTGGLGALGLFSAEWMVARGARHITLIGRSAPSSEVEERLAAMRILGAQVTVAQVDVADDSALAELLRKQERPLAGVVHAAGVLDDGALLELTDRRVAQVLRPKVAGACNLRRIAEKAPLDFFVLFSSAVSVVGSPGQASYIAANAFLDAMAHDMRAQGLPALSINWGPWAEAGMADRTLQKKEQDSSYLIKLIHPSEGVEIFGRSLSSPHAQLMVLPYDMRYALQFLPDGAGLKLYTELLEGDVHVPKQEVGDSRLHPRPKIAQEYIAPSNDTERVIAGLWQRSLGLERVGVEDNFFELGGDSMFAGHLVTELNRAFGTSLVLKDAFEFVTVRSWSKLVRARLLEKIDAMSDEEAERLLAEQS